ncbi:MAG: hypothetical protein K6D90_07620 [Lachnospiraceae bacterium]|nr:hypothetical protein [Lachnospiraceae bacterium]
MFEFLGLSDLTWLSGILCILCLIFGLFMVITKRPGFVRSFKDTADYKDKEKYSYHGGILILGLGGASLLVTVLSFFSTLVSNILGVIALIVFAIFWKKMNDQYGPE